MQKYKLFNINKNKNIIYFLSLCFLISTIIRFLIFPKLGLLQNDDYLYHLISTTITIILTTDTNMTTDTTTI